MIGKKHRYHTGSKRRFAWIYSSPRWKALRQTVLKRADGQCEECYSIGETQVHHRVPIAMGGSIWDEKNLIAICRSCHLEMHRKIEAERLPIWQRKLYDLIDRPVTPRLQRIKTLRRAVP